MAHDEGNLYREGDTVRIEESRPLSKQKRWVAIERTEMGVISRSEAEGEPGTVSADV